MGYLVQKTRVASLTVDGVDYTSSLISWQVSDQSAQNNGFMTTAGRLVLGQRPGQADIEDYDRNIFKRGAEVILDITDPGGSSYRHPRGLLYVVTVSYDVENEELEIALGCKLTLLRLIDDYETLLPLVPIPLDPAQENLQSISGSFSSAGKILYQNNQGALVSRKFFGNDGFSGIEAGAWVSVLGETALQVEPLGASGAIPDEIDLTYQVPIGVLAGDNTGKVDTVEEVSNYFINYPVTIFERQAPPENPEDAQSTAISLEVNVGSGGSGGTSGCGNTPNPPGGGGSIAPRVEVGEQSAIACQEGWTTERVDKYLPAERTATSVTTYGAPGGQVSYVKQTVYGPAIEANSGYYADKFAYCTSVYGYGCNPTGNCAFDGMQTILLSYSETFNEYDEESNVLVKTIQDSYANKISAANTTDYRSGINNGFPQDFTELSTDDTYRVSRVVTEYFQEENANVELTTTYSSITSRGAGISTQGSIDALDGIRTTVRRESTTTTTLDIRPDTVNSPTTATEEGLTKILLNTNSFQVPPSESGPYIIRQNIPVPLLSENAAEIEGWVADYSYYLTGFIKGDLFGLRIGEALRTEIASSWYPGMPFRYADTSNGKILAMRMDACSWGITQDEAIVVTNGVWTGFSSGTLSIGSNLVGNSAPNLGGGAPTPPPAPDAPPVIDDDLVGDSYSFEINVEFNLSSSMFTYFENPVTPPNPTDLSALMEMTLVPYVGGAVVAPGGLLETEGDGSIPLDANGSLIISAAVVIDGDVFDPT